MQDATLADSGVLLQLEFCFLIASYVGVLSTRRLSISCRSQLAQCVEGGLLQFLEEALERDLFVFGGRPPQHQVFRTGVLPEGAAGYWEDVAPMIAIRSNCVAAALGEKIYVVGGWADGGLLLATDEAFDLPSQRWQPMPPMPSRRVLAAAIAVRGRMFVLGGIGPQGFQVDVTEVFKPSQILNGSQEPCTGDWSQLAPLQFRRSSAVAAVGCGSDRVPLIFVVGGLSRSGRHLSTVEMMRLNGSNTENWSWQESPPMPCELVSAAGVAHRGSIYVVGGWGRSAPVATTLRFDPCIGVWENLDPMPTPRAVCAAAATCSRIYVIGGRIAGAQATRAVERLDPESGVWEQAEPIPTGRTGCVAVAAWR